MPGRTAARQHRAGPGHAGVASGVLNAARQAGGALGVALLGSLLSGIGGGHGLALPSPLGVAAACLLAAVGLAWQATAAAADRTSSSACLAGHARGMG